MSAPNCGVYSPRHLLKGWIVLVNGLKMDRIQEEKKDQPKAREIEERYCKGREVEFFSRRIDTWGQLSVCLHFGAVRTPI
jgi:hypothetical protein